MPSVQLSQTDVCNSKMAKRQDTMSEADLLCLNEIATKCNKVKENSVPLVSRSNFLYIICGFCTQSHSSSNDTIQKNTIICGFLWSKAYCLMKFQIFRLQKKEQYMQRKMHCESVKCEGLGEI